jgi:putative hemolysin
MILLLAQLLLIVLCLAGAAFFAGIETGVISMNRLRLRHLVRHKAPGADVLEYFLHDTDHLLGTTLAGTNLCHVAASVLTADLGAQLMGAAGTAAATVLLVVVMLPFCEYLPKAWFQSSPTLRALPFAWLLKFSGKALLPLSVALGLLMRLMTPRRAAEARAAQPMVTRDELLHLATEGARTGVITVSEHRMIHSIFELRDTTVGDIMVPKANVVTVQTDMTAEDLVNLARTREFNRFPVYDASKVAYVGIVHVFDVLSDRSSQGKKVSDYMRPPQFVAHETPADHVLPRMRITRQPLIMVLDAQYEFSGIVTIEDVLEEVVGQI